MDKKLKKRVLLATLASTVILMLVPSFIFLLFRHFGASQEAFHGGLDALWLLIASFLIGLFFSMIYLWGTDSFPGKHKGIYLAVWFIIGIALAKELSVWVFVKYSPLNCLARFLAYGISYLIMGLLVPRILVVKKSY